MDGTRVRGMLTFVLSSLALSLVFQLLLELAGLGTGLWPVLAVNLVAVPIAVAASQRLGRIDHASLLLASVVYALLAFALVVALLDRIAQPAGGQMPWSDLFNAVNRRHTVMSVVAMLVVPQCWLLISRWMQCRRSPQPPVIHDAV